MSISLRGLCLTLVLTLALAVFTGTAKGQTAGDRVNAGRIPFKQVEQSTSGLIFRVLGGLAVAGLVGVGVIYAIRRYFPSAYHPTFGGPSHVKVIEIRRLTPKATLFVVEFDGVRLLLGHAGDRIVTLCHGQKNSSDSGVEEA